MVGKKTRQVKAAARGVVDRNVAPRLVMRFLANAWKAQQPEGRKPPAREAAAVPGVADRRRGDSRVGGRSAEGITGSRGGIEATVAGRIEGSLEGWAAGEAEIELDKLSPTACTG